MTRSLSPGYAQSDIPFDIESYRGPRPGQGYDFSVNRNDVDLRLALTPSDRVVAVVDTRLRYFASTRPLSLAETNDRPVWTVHRHARPGLRAVKGALLDWVDFKAGRLSKSWGRPTCFNPTDNLNARDFLRPMDYTHKVRTRWWRSISIRRPG